jgi:rRNA small subunit pseudouridine methyltransferase Nep1
MLGGMVTLMLTLLLADAEIERIPDAILVHPSVRSHAKRRGKKPSKLLLDSSVHHRALEALVEGERRGRPDVVHFFLLLCQDSILNQEGKLQTLVHTRNDQLIRIRPDTRIPKNYNRFVGLMEDLFERGAVPPGKGEPLMSLGEEVGFDAAMDSIDPDITVALSPDGERGALQDLFSEYGPDKNICCIIGGFTMGDFRSDIYKKADEKISIHDATLKVWTVTSEVLSAYRLNL